MRNLTPRPHALRERSRSLIDVELDPAQRAAVSQPAGGAMLVLGEAGHGKTTVALHRLAHLYRAAQGRFRAVVLVPHTALAGLLQPLVTKLGADVRVLAYDTWARWQARRAFGDIPRRESVDVAPAVMRLKRSSALQPLLRDLASRPPGRIDDDEDAPPPDTRAHAHRGDLQHLFGDGERMHTLAAHSGESERSVAAILEHTHQQFQPRAELAYSHVDAERLVALDRHSLDLGTAAQNASTIDTEDYAVMFELDRLRARANGLRPTRPRPFDCIVIDEAQELAPLELALIGRSLTRGGSLVVAGDADQRMDPAAGWESWDATLRALRAPDYTTIELAISYRCPPHVVALARALRAGERPPNTVPVQRFAREAELAAWIARVAAPIVDDDPTATICVLTRRAPLARRLAAGLRGHVPCKLVLDGDFKHHRGIDVTTVAQIKGLEFDYVVVADVDAREYPDDPESRRTLYVATTRARHELVLAHIGTASPLLPEPTPAPAPSCGGV
ncbi:MAG: ATP-binding domain-containing protein [Polyangiales bacterium]